MWKTLWKLWKSRFKLCPPLKNRPLCIVHSGLFFADV